MSLKKEPLYRQVATRITGKRKQRKKINSIFMIIIKSYSIR